MRYLIARAWRYLFAVLNHVMNQRVDMRIQVELAVEEARRRHLLLTEQAASVVGHERELEIKVQRAAGEMEKLRSATAQALLLADREAKDGEPAKAAEHERTASLFATRLATAEKMAAELEDARTQAEAAAAAARRAVEGSAQMLNAKLAEATRLTTQIEAARMQERVADALASMDSLAPSGATPSLDEVRSRVDRRLSVASARAELAGSSASAGMLQIERAALEHEAELKLLEIRQSLRLPASSDTAAADSRPAGDIGKGGN